MSNPALRADYLFACELIKEQLRVELGANTPVEGIEEMAGADDTKEKRPVVVYVMWGGEQFDTSASGRAGSGSTSSQRVTQRWLVLLRVRNLAAGDATNASAGQYLSRVHAALNGWEPRGAMRQLVRAQAPAPKYTATSGLYPLAFDLNLVL